MNLAYHRLFRARTTYRWWKPLVALVVGAGFYYALLLAYQEIFLLLIGGFGGAAARDAFVAAWQRNQQDASRPLVLLFTLGSISMMLPAVVIAVRLLGLGRFGTVASVVGRLRWRWLARCILPGLVFVGLTVALNLAVPTSWQGPQTSSGAATPVPALVVSIVLILVFVPLQATGEEFAFRGFGTQTIGSWIRPPVFAIVLPTVAFALAHDYNLWGKLDVAALGVSFGYLAWRTGGLEAGIVGHVLNNVLVFLLAAPTVATAQSDGTPAGAAITVITSAVYILLVTWVARRHEPERVTPVENAVVSSVVPPRLVG